MEISWKRESKSDFRRDTSYEGTEVGVELKWKLLNNFNFGNAVLDVGCGVGDHLRMFRNPNFITIGLDPEVNFLQIGKMKDHAYDFVQAIGENNPFCDNTFNLVLLFEVLEHVINPTLVLGENKG